MDHLNFPEQVVCPMCDVVGGWTYSLLLLEKITLIDTKWTFLALIHVQFYNTYMPYIHPKINIMKKTNFPWDFILVSYFVCAIKYMKQRHLKEGMVHFGSQLKVHSVMGTSRHSCTHCQEESNGCFCWAWSLLSIQFTTQPREWCSPQWTGLLSREPNQDNAQQAWPEASLPGGSNAGWQLRFTTILIQ